MSSAFVILDSSALIAQINVKDLWHKKANTISEFIERTDRKVILPAEVLAETLNRIGNNISRQDAVLAGNALLERNETGDILITPSNTDIIATTLTRDNCKCCV
jgi:predicted nucleic acid-binding protein